MMLFQVFTAVNVKILVWLRCDTVEFGRQVLNCLLSHPRRPSLSGTYNVLLLLEFPVDHKKFTNHYFIKLLRDPYVCIT